MRYLIMLLGATAWGVVFESFIAVHYRGFYTITALITAVIYAWSPFRLVAANILASVLCGITVFIIASVTVTEGIFPTLLFLTHGMVFVVLSELILYGIGEKTLQRHRY